MNDNFKYVIDEFADIKILKFEVPDFNKLSFKEKEYVYYLSEASLWGRDITWLQFGKNNLILRKTLENIIETYSQNRDEYFRRFEIYTKRVLFSCGFHHHYNKHKFYPECSKEYLEELLDNSNEKGFDLNGKNLNEFKEFIIKLIYDDEEVKNDIILDDYTDFYENITEIEAKEYYKNVNILNQKEPISFGLNSKLVKIGDELKEIKYSVNGLYSDYIEKIIYYLKKAFSVAQNNNQREYTKLLIDYYNDGDLTKWDQYNVSWVKDNESNIDYISGFIEVYDDPIGHKGTYEALVNMKDIETTKLTNIIADNAEWFEKNSPVDPRFKKEIISGIKAKAIHAITLAGGCYPLPPIGINLPNADWIREKHGSKSVTITNLTEAYSKAHKELPAFKKKEFIYSDEELALQEKYGDLADDLHTHLHECLGHGSGKLLDGISSNALKEYHSALEEARADIFSLYYMADTKTIEIGISPSLDLAKSYYSSYIRGGLQTQLTRIDLGKNLVEAHMVARGLIANWSYERAKKDNIIEKIVKDDKTYFIVNDFVKLREIFRDLLIELQRIKSTGDYEAGKSLILNYGTKIDYDLHKETLERYNKLNLKPYTGFVNPHIVPIIVNNQIADYQIQYSDNFLVQNLEYSKKYSM